MDDDGDGLTDMADPGCSGPLDDSEYSAPPPPPPPPPPGGGEGHGPYLAPKEFFALAHSGPLDLKDLQKIRDINVRVMRVGLNWKRVEPSRNRFAWPDRQIAQLAANGIRAAITVYGAPPWATGSNYSGVPPIQRGRPAWEKFMQQAVLRYRPGGSFWRQNPALPVEPVKSWQIWNEPNLVKYFATLTGHGMRLVGHAPEAYAQLVKIASRAIKTEDPQAKVILAGLTAEAESVPKEKMASLKFLKRFLEVKGIGKYFDAVGLHPYVPSIKKYEKAIDKTRTVMRKGGAGSKELWLTEMGWGSGAPTRFHLNKGIAGQAKFLKKSFTLTLANRKKWKIGRMFWFDWRDPNPNLPSLCSFCASAGLLRFDGSHKPAFKKFKHFTKLQGKPRHRRHHRHHRG